MLELAVQVIRHIDAFSQQPVEGVVIPHDVLALGTGRFSDHLIEHDSPGCMRDMAVNQLQTILNATGQYDLAKIGTFGGRFTRGDNIAMNNGVSYRAQFIQGSLFNDVFVEVGALSSKHAQLFSRRFFYFRWIKYAQYDPGIIRKYCSHKKLSVFSGGAQLVQEFIPYAFSRFFLAAEPSFFLEIKNA